MSDERDRPRGVRFVNCTAKGAGGHGFNVGQNASFENCDVEGVGGDAFHIRDDVRVPKELAEAFAEAVQSGQDVETIAKTFGDRLKGYGVGLERAIALGANLATLATALIARST